MLNLAVSAGQKTAKWNKNPLDVMQPLEKQSYAVIHAQLNFISLYIWPGGGMRPNFQTGTGRIINQKDLMPEGFVAGLFYRESHASSDALSRRNAPTIYTARCSWKIRE
jgi:hypothetical protein